MAAVTSSAWGNCVLTWSMWSVQATIEETMVESEIGEQGREERERAVGAYRGRSVTATGGPVNRSPSAGRVNQEASTTGR